MCLGHGVTSQDVVGVCGDSIAGKHDGVNGRKSGEGTIDRAMSEKAAVNEKKQGSGSLHLTYRDILSLPSRRSGVLRCHPTISGNTRGTLDDSDQSKTDSTHILIHHGRRLDYFDDTMFSTTLETKRR